MVIEVFVIDRALIMRVYSKRTKRGRQEKPARSEGQQLVEKQKVVVQEDLKIILAPPHGQI